MTEEFKRELWWQYLTPAERRLYIRYTAEHHELQRELAGTFRLRKALVAKAYRRVERGDSPIGQVPDADD